MQTSHSFATRILKLLYIIRFRALLFQHTIYTYACDNVDNPKTIENEFPYERYEKWNPIGTHMYVECVQQTTTHFIDVYFFVPFIIIVYSLLSLHHTFQCNSHTKLSYKYFIVHTSSID